jgi:hypothetical protein
MSTDIDGTHGNENGSIELSESDRHRLLSNERRRQTLDALADRATPIDLDELAEAVAARERKSGDFEDEAIERVTIALHHNHLPTIGEVGVIDYDADSNRVVRRSDALGDLQQ